jgi:hypothetical protein
VTVRNTSPRAIHAWGVAILIEFPNERLKRGGASSDSYMMAERPETHVVPPGETRTVDVQSWPAGRSADEAAGLSAVPTFAIFDDDTSVGDEGEIDFYFTHRARNQRAWPAIEKVFADAAAAGGDARATLVAAQQGLTTITDGSIRESHAFQWVDRMLSMNMKFVTDHAALLKTLTDGIRERRDATAQHYRRR